MTTLEVLLEPVGQAPAPTKYVARGWPERVRRPGWAALLVSRVASVVQAVVMLRLSIGLYDRDEVTWDFSIYNQAAWLIAHGHLNPYDTVRGMPFLANNFELVIYPLALLTRLPGGGIWLLFVQDIALVATGWVAISWVAEAARSKRWSSPLPVGGVVLATAALVIFDPLAWSAASFDFHSEVVGGCFALLAARAMWRGTSVQAWAWAAATMACGTVPDLYLVAVGVAALLSRGGERPVTTRVMAYRVVGVSAGCIVALSLLGVTRGSTLAANYGYLAGSGALTGMGLTTSGAAVPISRMLLGGVVHPSRWLHQLGRNAVYLRHYINYGGLLGLFSPLGLMAVACIFLPNMLASGDAFSKIGFQNEPAVGFLVVATMFTASRIAVRLAGVSPRSIYALALTVVVFASYNSYRVDRAAAVPFESLSPQAAAAVAQARNLVPAGVEVVASDAIAGRFSARPVMYTILRSPQVVPVVRGPVYFVILAPGTGLPGSDAGALVDQIEEMGGQLVARISGRVAVLDWYPPSGIREVTLQGPISYNDTTDPDIFRPPGNPPCRYGLCRPNALLSAFERATEGRS